MYKSKLYVCGFLTGIVLVLGVPRDAIAIDNGDSTDVKVASAPVIEVDGVAFSTWHDYTHSALFQQKGLRCATTSKGGNVNLRSEGPGDCTYTLTNPHAGYDPTVARYIIPVVVHVIRDDLGIQGAISMAMVQSQIDILNEDFLALAGSNGENGTNIQIEFQLATEDPIGNPTNGITYSNNSTWLNDSGSYWDFLAWDTNRYLNIYTNKASGALGYVPDLPQGGIAGSNFDRVVVLWSSFGRNGPIGPPFDQGRTTTHEVGHYLGLEHTFSGGCAPVLACYTNGDLICDTNPEGSPTFGCTDSNSCSSPDPIQNYLDYSDDLCMEEFTPEQARRMRCSLENYRPDLWISGFSECGNGINEFGEECDDGGTVPGDGCDEACQYEHTCGDGILENGEQCDDSGESSTCDVDCTTPMCGDGTHNASAGEECDDAGPSVSCTGNCTLPLCGTADTLVPQAELIGDLPSIKNRFLSFSAGDPGRAQALRVTLVALPPPFDVWNGFELWVGIPSAVSENGGSVSPIPGFPNFVAATLQCTEPVYLDWSSLGTIHVFHEAIVPGGLYRVQAIDSTCLDIADPNSYSAPLEIPTAFWGDTVKDCSTIPCPPPVGVGDVGIIDVLAILGGFANTADSIVKTRADLQPGCLDLIVNISDVLRGVNGFQGLDYPFLPSAPDPCDSMCLSPLS